MNTRTFRALGLGLAALLLGAAPNGIAQAQSAFGAFAENPSSALARHLRTLVANPRNLDALRGAGRAALEVGDLDAAVGFFARAEEVAPRDGRTKAGLGSAFTMLRQPSAALRYFQDAVSLGVPALEIARDRGLAYDLRGNTRLAQADYKLVLASRPDPEVTRRLALSQAISGDQKSALATLQPQLNAKTPAAWRVRAFVLAIGGDAAGATRAAQSVMPVAQAIGFAPYFRRMPSLKASEKAAAAHFGSFPGDPGAIRMTDLMSEGERAARVALESVARTPALEAGRPDAGQAALGRTEGQVPVSTSGSRVALSARPVGSSVAPRNPATNARPGFSGDLIRIVGTRVDAPAVAVAAATRTGFVAPTSPPFAQPAPTPAPVPTLNTTPALTPPPSQGAPSSTGAPTSAPATAAAAPAVQPTASSPAPIAQTSPGGTGAPIQGPPAPTDLLAVTASAGSTGSAASVPALATQVASTTQAQPLPTTASAPPPVPKPKVETTAPVTAAAPPPPQPKIERLAQAAPPAAQPKIERAAPAPTGPRVETPARTSATAAPARHYAQVGIGQDVRALAGDWRRLRARAGTLLSDQAAWTAKLNRTNRLLVGPFPSARDAQAFVNRLTAAKVTAVAFSSAPGELVTPVGQ